MSCLSPVIKACLSVRVPGIIHHIMYHSTHSNKARVSVLFDHAAWSCMQQLPQLTVSKKEHKILIWQTALQRNRCHLLINILKHKLQVCCTYKRLTLFLKCLFYVQHEQYSTMQVTNKNSSICATVEVCFRPSVVLAVCCWTIWCYRWVWVHRPRLRRWFTGLSQCASFGIQWCDGSTDVLHHKHGWPEIA